MTSWNELAAERDPAKKVEMMLGMGLLVRTPAGELTVSEQMAAFIEAEERRARRLVPVFDHVAGKAECYHRPTAVGVQAIDAREMEETLREADRLLRERRG